jgi:hypothetical protein
MHHTLLRPSGVGRLGLATAAACLLALPVCAASISKVPQPQTLTADQDRQLMMQKLDITALRAEPSGNEKAQHHATYDPAIANPYPLPDPLTFKDGRKVTSPAQWAERRAELVEDFSREMYGRVPANVPKVTWRVVAEDHERVGIIPVIAKKMVGHVDNSAYPGITVDIAMTVVVPLNVKGPVPMLMMFGRSDFPNPVEPVREEFEKIDAAMKALLVKQDPSLKAIFDRYKAYAMAKPTPMMRMQVNPDADPPSIQQLIADGWGFAVLDPASVQADNGAGLTRGIIGLVNKGQPRKPDDWGSLRAWAWGAGRGFDYLASDPVVDAKHIGIEGVSRYGKAALVTMAFDERFAMVLIGSSGKGGATPMRRVWGEDLTNLTGSEYYWMAGNFLKYGAAEPKSTALGPNNLPVDSNELIALCAPRLTFVSYGVHEKGDAHWLDHEGSFMATINAGAVFKLLGAKDIGLGNDEHTAKMPPVNAGLLEGQLAWRQHDGGHTDQPNVKYFLQWADKFIDHQPPAQ